MSTKSPSTKQKTMSHIPNMVHAGHRYASRGGTKSIENFICTHPITQNLRSNRRFTESRPHLHAPDILRGKSLLGGSLAGSDKITVPPYIFKENNGKRCVMMMHLGSDVCSHPGVVHGGLLATLLDESFVWCCFPRLPEKVGVTANLSVDYRAPALAGSYIVLNAEIVKLEGRKAWLEGRIETLEAGGADSTLIAEARALFVQPKQAAVSISKLLREEKQS
ncbi:hypothetical protein MYU51_018499 [Penicillium brevicompactum]